MKVNWLDRAASSISPAWGVRRVRARMVADTMQRSYDAAATGRRTQGWRRNSGDSNTVLGPSLGKLRDVARDLVRNNAYAESALATIVDHTVGWGIEAAETHPAFLAWANSTDCDADGRHDLAGLQKLVMRTTAESGEVLVRRRWRRLEDGLALPLQLQLLEPDFLDTSKDAALLPNGGRIVQGVEFDPLGRRAAYWLFREHPGASVRGGALISTSSRVSADDVTHVFKASRPGQVRGPTWFAPVLLRFNDFADYEDATLMKQKIAACLAVFVTDTDGTSTPMGTETPATSSAPAIDALAPGMIQNLPIGRDIRVVDPPSSGDYKEFSQTSLRAIATGLGVSYEDLTGDYTNLPFSAARMSRIRHWARVEDWRWRMLVPMFLNPVWRWAAEGAELAGAPPMAARTDWTPPPMPMIEPDKEGLAIMRNVRAGIQTYPDALRERGYIPAAFLKEYAESNKQLDDLGIVLDSDPRKMTQAGQVQGTPAYPTPPAAAE